MLWQENKDMRRAKEGKKYVDVRKNWIRKWRGKRRNATEFLYLDLDIRDVTRWKRRHNYKEEKTKQNISVIPIFFFFYGLGLAFSGLPFPFILSWEPE
jgi:hypothetical protein